MQADTEIMNLDKAFMARDKTIYFLRGKYILTGNAASPNKANKNLKAYHDP